MHEFQVILIIMDIYGAPTQMNPRRLKNNQKMGWRGGGGGSAGNNILTNVCIYTTTLNHTITAIQQQIHDNLGLWWWWGENNTLTIPDHSTPTCTDSRYTQTLVFCVFLLLL